MYKFLIVPLIVFCSTACADSSGGKGIPAKCDVSTTYISVSRSEWAMYIFDSTGITFHVSPIPYAKPWNLVTSLSYSRQKDVPSRGLISSVAIESGKQETVAMGVIDDGCWNAIKKFIASNKVEIKILEQ
jgi:hypothetical protein